MQIRNFNWNYAFHGKLCNCNGIFVWQKIDIEIRVENFFADDRVWGGKRKKMLSEWISQQCLFILDISNMRFQWKIIVLGTIGSYERTFPSFHAIFSVVKNINKDTKPLVGWIGRWLYCAISTTLDINSCMINHHWFVTNSVLIRKKSGNQ